MPTKTLTGKKEWVKRTEVRWGQAASHSRRNHKPYTPGKWSLKLQHKCSMQPFVLFFLNRLLVFCLLCTRTYYCLEPGLASAPQFSSSIHLKVWHKFPMVQISFLSPERQHQRAERNTKDWSKSLARPYSFFTHHWKPNKQDTAPFLSALMPVPWNTTKHPCRKNKQTSSRSFFDSRTWNL